MPKLERTRVNQSTEDYIKGIYKLGQLGTPVSTSELAKHLSVGDGSVTDMMKKLSTKKLIQYKPYKGVLLTGSGKKLALRMVRRHRLWEMFLVKYLGYRWDEIHGEAEQLEHVTSDELDRRLDRLLGSPKFDPHGDPIPDRDGEIKNDEQTALTEFESGDAVTIVRVTDDPDVLQHAAELGLQLKTRILVKQIMKFDGSLKVKVGRRERFISRELGDAIFGKLS